MASRGGKKERGWGGGPPLVLVRTSLGGKLAPGLDEVPEGRRGTLERAICVSRYLGDIGLVRCVAGHDCACAQTSGVDVGRSQVGLR